MQQPSRTVLPPRAVWVPPWIPLALGEIGVLEDTRPGKSHPRIEQFHAITSGGAAPDDVPWCASYVSWVLEMAGVKSTKSKMAASYATWGVVCPRLAFGCVVLMGKSDKDAAGSGHVGFAIGAVGATDFLLLGGNQGDRVSVDYRKVANIAALRWPPGYAIPPQLVP